LALDDLEARAWLPDHQRDDGSLGLVGERFADLAVTPLAALAFAPGPQREAALDFIESRRGRTVAATHAIPLDESVVGWSWTRATASWVEPTGRALWALRMLRPSSPAIADGVALLVDRESVGGGWNYGNRVVFDEELPAFAQTTAAALIGLAGIAPALESRGLRALHALWRSDAPGPLTLAMCSVAFAMHGDRGSADAVRRELRRQIRTTTLESDAITWAWVVLSERDEVGVG
jgi:hypothetical protein